MSFFSSIFVFSFVLILQLTPFKAFAAQQVYFDHFSVNHGISQNSITCIMSDKQGFIWMGTQNGLNKIDGYEVKKYKTNNKLGSIQGNWITGCQRDNLGRLWFSTASSGLNVYEPSTGFFSHYDSNTADIKINDDGLLSLLIDGNYLWVGTAKGGVNRINLQANQVEIFTNQESALSDIRALYKDSGGILWVGSAQGLFYFDAKSNKLKLFQPKLGLNNLAIWAIAEDKNRALWITGRGGVFKVNKDTHQVEEYQLPAKANNWGTSILALESGMQIGTYGAGVVVFDLYGQQLENYIHIPLESNSLSNDYVLSLYKDPTSNIWIGTDGGGVNRFIPGRLLFNHQKHQAGLAQSLSHSFVRAITVDSNDNLWVATRDGLNKRDVGQTGFKRYVSDRNILNSLPNNNVFSLFSSPSLGLWLGTYGGGLAQYNTLNDNFTQYQHEPERTNSLISNRIYAIEGAEENRLWLGSNAGLSLFDPNTDTSQHFRHDEAIEDSLSDNIVFSLLTDRQNRLWVGTRSGLNLMKPDGTGFVHFGQGDDQLTAAMVTSLHQDNEGMIWVGTMRGLNRLNPDTHQIIQFTESQGLIDENIFAIEEDSLGFLWVSSNNGLMRLNKANLKISHVKVEAGLQERSFILGSSYQDSRGHLYFGGVNGFNEFNPEDVLGIAILPEVSLSKLLLLNEEVAVTQVKEVDSFNLTKQIDELQGIELDHRYNLFALEFTSAASLQSQSIQYAYQLIGFDPDWVMTKEQKRFATYTNLPAGTYHFVVKARFLEGDWGPTKQLNITIHPAPWHSWWAYCLYTFVIGGILLSVVWLIYRRKIDAQEKRHSLKLIEAKDSLLATISHEFKTPLTLILGPLAGIIAKTAIESDRNNLIAMEKNAERLLILVNNVLKHKSIYDQHSSLECINIRKLVDTHIHGFSVLAQHKDVTLSVADESLKNCFVYFQPNAADQLVSNLLHNAIKFTPAGGEVVLSVIKSAENCILSIMDTGVGIAADEVAHIFDQGKRGSLTQNQEGFGLGLAIVKDIITQHGGEISVISTPKQGSTFSVVLPLVDDVQGTDQSLVKVNIKSDTELFQKLESTYKVLIVEDNSELRDYLLTILSPYFSCFTAVNGDVGLTQISAILPDLVISDVMMPVMSGFEFLEQLRNDLETCHIPVLLLSAYHSSAMRMKGFDLLADEYLAKPFDEKELIGRVHNLLSLRKLIKRSNLQASISKDQCNKGQLNGYLSERDSQFTEQLNAILNQHFSDVALSLEMIAELLHLTERTLQNKTKALFDMSPMDYVREFRLEKAKVLLRQTDHSIGKVTELSGFNSQSYFARCFKVATGVTPKQYRAEQQNVA